MAARRNRGLKAAQDQRGVAVLTAMLDLWIIRTRTRMARRDLLRKTFGAGTNLPPDHDGKTSGSSVEEN